MEVLMRTNILYKGDCEQIMANLPDKSVDLILADPPYFETKGDFDFIFKDFNDWKEHMLKWSKQFHRVLKDTGSLLVYGHAKRIAYQQVIFDLNFDLLNSLVWEKKECQTRKGVRNYHLFAPVTERILFYQKDAKILKRNIQKARAAFYSPIIDYLRVEKEKAMRKGYRMKKVIGSNMGGHYFGRSQWSFPSRKDYEKLQRTGFFQVSYRELKRDYDRLSKKFNRTEKKQVSRYFHNKNLWTDVVRLSQESNITGKYKHPTQKPPFLSRGLIESTCPENGVIVIPFAGSGVECVEADKLNRKWIACELENSYITLIRDRFAIELQKEIEIA
jgi:site-specific DNA-methyltransferase (adenine-specific)